MNNTLLITTRKDIYLYLNDNFDHIYYINNNSFKCTLRKIIKYIKNNNFKQVIIEDYFNNFDYLLNLLLENKIKVKLIWTKGVGTLNDPLELDNLSNVIKLYESKKIASLGFTDKSMYLLYKDKGCSLIKYTVKDTNIENFEEKNNDNVSVIGNGYNWQSNVYNQLSAIKMNNYDLYNLNDINIVRRYLKFWNITTYSNYTKLNCDTFRDNLDNISLCSCVEFSNLYDLYCIDSYNHGVPVVLGNNTLFFKGTKLEDKVIVKSDDSINEIADKMKYCLNNRKSIIKEYNSLKKDYDIESKESIEEFINE